MSNLLRGFETFCIYEINIPHLNDYIEEDKLPIEKWFLSLLLINSNKNSEESPYYVAKRYATLLFDNLNIQNVSFQLIADCLELELTAHMRNSINLFEPNSSALVFHQGIVLGIIGEIKNSIKSNFKLPVFTAGLDIDIQQLTEIKSDIKKYKGQPIYPAFMQDLCFEIEEKVEYQNIYDIIEKHTNREPLYGIIDCIDIYKDKKEKGRKRRITFRITVSNYNKTLNQEDRSKIVKKIKEEIEEKLEGVLI